MEGYTVDYCLYANGYQMASYYTLYRIGYYYTLYQIAIIIHFIKLPESFQEMLMEGYTVDYCLYANGCGDPDGLSS